MGNGEAKELTCTAQGHELRGWVGAGGRGACMVEGNKGRKKGTTVIAQSIEYIF